MTGYTLLKDDFIFGPCMCQLIKRVLSLLGSSVGGLYKHKKALSNPTIFKSKMAPYEKYFNVGFYFLILYIPSQVAQGKYYYHRSVRKDMYNLFLNSRSLWFANNAGILL